MSKAYPGYIRFNINYYVRVKLTEYGKKILRENYEEFRKSFPLVGDYQEPKEDENGWSKWQLWVLMSELGQYCCAGGNQPFETEIELELI